MLQIGQQAPDFTLFDSDKNEVSLKDFKGKKVVLLFFPLAFTGTCTKEFCIIRDNLNDYTSLNAEIAGISIDSLFVLDRYKKENRYNVRMLSDFNKEVATAYGCLYDTFVHGMKGVAKRSAFVIDEKGIIRHIEILEKAGELPDFEAIKAALN